MKKTARGTKMNWLSLLNLAQSSSMLSAAGNVKQAVLVVFCNNRMCTAGMKWKPSRVILLLKSEANCVQLF